MDVHIVFGTGKEKNELAENLIEESLRATARFLAEKEISESELLADLIYEDFVKCR
jgi:hypothetical protein